MSAPRKLAAFAAGLAASLALGWALGTAAGPFDTTPSPAHPHAEDTP